MIFPPGGAHLLPNVRKKALDNKILFDFGKRSESGFEMLVCFFSDLCEVFGDAFVTVLFSTLDRMCLLRALPSILSVWKPQFLFMRVCPVALL